MIIITRYLMKEVITTLLGVTLVLLLIFLSHLLVRYLGSAASGKIAANIVLQLMGLEIPYLLALLLPIGLYLGIILAYGRLYAESEMPVLQACGLGVGRLLMITMLLAIGIASLVCLLMLWLNPIIATTKSDVLAKGLAQDNILDRLQAGRFQVMNDGKRVVYVERISRDRRSAHNIFIAEEQTKTTPSATLSNPWTVVSASRGYQRKEAATQEHFIVSAEGYRYDGIPGQNDYKITQFREYAVRIPEVALGSKRQEEEAIPTRELWQNYQNADLAAELQWRLSIGILTLVLILLAVPLSRIRPRQGRYSHLFPAILIYIVYINLLFVSRNWVEEKIIPISLGMWWIHILFAVLGIGLILKQMGYRVFRSSR